MDIGQNQPFEGLRSEDVEILKELPSMLVREGYLDAYMVFGFLHLRVPQILDHLEALPTTVATLLKLLFLNHFVPREEVEGALPSDVITSLFRLGVLMEFGGRVHTGKLILVPVLGHFMFFMAATTRPVAYFGDDSIALAVHITPRHGARCLDLCSGPGIQALRAVAAGGRVVAVEINPVAAACAQLNMVMNSVEDRVEVRQGDLYDVLDPSERFDFLSANPPLLPFPPELPYPFVGHGGADGLAVTRRILEKLPEVLTAAGTAQIIGSCLGDADGPHPRGYLDQYAQEHDLQIMFTVPARTRLRPGDFYFEGLAWTCARAAGLDREEVRQRLHEHLIAQNAEYLYPFYLTISRPSRRPGLSMTRHFRRDGGFWFRDS